MLSFDYFDFLPDSFSSPHLICNCSDAKLNIPFFFFATQSLCCTVKIALKTSGDAIKYVTEDLIADREVIKQAIISGGEKVLGAMVDSVETQQIIAEVIEEVEVS